VNLFVIHCTTCQARLKVNDESAIGGIYACPKCGSMVQVLPPPETQAPAAPGAARSPAKPKPAKPQTVKLQVAKPLAEGGATQVPNAEPVTASTSAEPAAAAAKGATPPPLPARKAAADAASIGVAAALLPAVGAASTSKIALATHAAVKYVRQEPWLFGGALAAGIGIGTVIWLAVASGGAVKAEPEPSTAAQTSAVLASAENRDQVDTRSQPTDRVETAAGDSNIAPRPQSDAQASLADDSADDPTSEKPADVSEQAAGAPQTASDDEPAAAAADESAGPADAGEQAAVLAAAPESADKPPVQHAGPQSSRQLEIESRLAGRVQSVEFRKVQLAEFALFISDLIAAPVELDLPALKAVGKGPESLVSVKLQKTTAAAALNAALENHGLVYAVRGDRVVVTTK